METIKNFLNGAFVAPESNQYFDNVEPATGMAYSSVPDSDERDIMLAVEAAKKAFPLWSNTPVEERSRILHRIADLIERRRDEFALAESRDTGKPLSLAKNVDMNRAVTNFRFFASAVVNFSSEAHPTENAAINYTLRNPVGIAGCISPWNLPLYLFTWKVAPALATGNCVIGKPSELAPMTVFLLGRVCVEAGLPPGVLNIIHGYGHKAGAGLVAHPDVSAISFTGGTKTGAEISRIAAPMFKKLSLELGGKNPTIVFSDSRYDEMLATTLRSSFSNQGEICFCGSRIFIERPLYKRFRDDFVAATKRLKVGDPLQEGTDQGALISKQHFEKILSYIGLAKKEGGTVLCGGEPARLDGHCAGGWFIQPTVIENLPYDCRTNQEEIFGPVVTITPFDSDEEVLHFANSTQYGLAATIWTENLSRAHRMAAALQSGIIWINCWMLRDLRTPFGGMKSSGVGREGGVEALRFFTEPKNVCIKL